MRQRLAALLLAASAVPAAAATIPGGYTSLVVFGDSFSDTGNLQAAVEAATDGRISYPRAPYNDGRFTGGDTWVDVVEDLWGLTDTVDLFNYAFGGALAETDPDDGIPDFAEQTLQFALEDPAVGDDPLGVAFFGGNDAIQATYLAGGSEELGISGIAGDETDPDLVQAAFDLVEAEAIAAADAILEGILDVGTDTIDTWLLVNLADVGAAPRFADPNDFGTNPDTGGSTAAYASAFTDAYNARLAEVADLLRAEGFQIVEVDLASSFEEILADPSAFGLADATSACGEYFRTILGLAYYDFRSDVCDEDDVASIDVPFWDDLHPNEILHVEIASVADEALTVALIPLPAPVFLFGGGLLLLGAVARRRRA